jgi:hypothetical protein
VAREAATEDGILVETNLSWVASALLVQAQTCVFGCPARRELELAIEHIEGQQASGGTNEQHSDQQHVFSPFCTAVFCVAI